MQFAIVFVAPAGCDPGTLDPIVTADRAGLTCLDIAVPQCVPICDPVVQDCSPGETCSFFGSGFGCWDTIEEPRALFEACEFANACEPGLACVVSEVATECPPDSSGCCTPYCDLDGPDLCPGTGRQCVPFFSPGEAPPGLKHLGICGFP
ncbi:hypothetical protein [Nannocystis radixulma]|uniref:Uncharacterized protein n=1 Tax=Nannocystis radixulma TaxID=2995305 RepID=A0ABT5BAY4_9BACT|nr:hypothetical protein [Nannocystis radixulma]MDC0670131.1 hypothetical protein [Nannocystis radixulma]